MKILPVIIISIALFALIFILKVNTDTGESDHEMKISQSQSEKKDIKYPNDIEYIKRTFPFYKADPVAHIEALKVGQRMRREAEFSNSDSFVPTWEFAGPTNVGGRISDLEYDPNNTDIIYAGASTGGVFKSTDGGLSFFPVFDDLAVLPIGDIAVDPINSDIIYAGTGEANGGHNNFSGGGIYKSTNGGQSWNFSGLLNSVTIGRIVINPINPLRIYAAAAGSYFAPILKEEFTEVMTAELHGQMFYL